MRRWVVSVYRTHLLVDSDKIVLTLTSDLLRIKFEFGCS